MSRAPAPPLVCLLGSVLLSCVAISAAGCGKPEVELPASVETRSTVASGGGLPAPPDLARAEPQVRAAITEDRDAIARDPGDAQAWGRYAGRLAVHEYLLEAVAAWERARKLDPQDFRWPYLTGVYLAQDDPQAALAATEAAMALNDRYAPLLLRYAAMMERLGRPADALRGYRRAVELAPGNAYAHAGLGGRLLEDGDRREARLQLDRALELDRSCRPALTRLVDWHRPTGDLAQARELARRAAAAPKARPPDPVLYEVDGLSVGTSAVLLRAAELTASGRRQVAIEALTALVAANPASARGRTELGNQLREQGRISLADVQYRAALQLDQDLLSARIGLAMSLVQVGRFEEARQEFERSRAAHPTSSEVHGGLAICLASMGRIDLAVESFRAAVELAPESLPSRVGYARALVLTGELAAAIDMLRPVVESAEEPLDELSAEAMALTGIALARTGQAAEAIVPLQRALRAVPTRADVRRELADMLAGAGRDRDAAGLLRDGMALQPSGGRTALALAWLLATSSDDGVRNGAQAVQLAERWLLFPGAERDGGRLDILACAYAEAGRFEDAQRAAERAIAMATQADKPDQAEAMTARLELFKQGRAYRSSSSAASRDGEPGFPSPRRNTWMPPPGKRP